MKIALVSHVEETVPPFRYGGAEWIVYHLAKGLGSLGNTVDLYAPGDSPQTGNYQLIPIVETSIRQLPEIMADPKLRQTAKLTAFSAIVDKINRENYDIIHNHAGWWFLLFTPFIKAPVVTTHHGPLNLPYQNHVFKQHRFRPHISISNNQRLDLPELNFVSTIYNALDISDYPDPSKDTMESRKEMLFLARMSWEKGAIEAAQVAKIAKIPITIAAKIDVADSAYQKKFDQYVDNNYVHYLGELFVDKKVEKIRSSRLLIAPIQWEEPFGLMFIEAMAAGVPVVCYARGAAPEIVVDGVTGFLVNQSEDLKRGDYVIKKTGIEGLVEAVKRIYAMNANEYNTMKMAGRKHVEEKFTVLKMVSEYNRVYKEIVDKTTNR